MSGIKPNETLLQNGLEDHRYYSLPKEKRSRWPIFLSVLLCVAAILILALVMMKCRGAAQRDDGTSLAELSEMCLDCIKIAEHPYNMREDDPLMDKLTKRMVDGVQKCCGNSKEQMEVLLELMLKAKKEKKSVTLPARSEFHSTPAAVHKSLIPAVDRPAAPGDVTCLRFDPDHNSPTEHVHGMSMSEDTVEVKYSGLYYIYSNLLIRHNQCGYPFFLYINLVRPNRPGQSGTLLESSSGICGHAGEETINTGSQLYLEAGDAIRVCVTDDALVEFAVETTNFGMFMIASNQ